MRDTGYLSVTNKTTNSVTILPEYAGEFTVTATSLDTGACVDSAKIFVVKVDYDFLIIPAWGTGQVEVTVVPDSVQSMLVFTNNPANIAAVSGSAPLLNVASITNLSGISEITATINGVSLLSTGQVVVFTATFRTNANVIDLPEGRTFTGEIEIQPTNFASQVMGQILVESTSPTNATVAGGGTNFTVFGHAYGTNSIYIAINNNIGRSGR